MYNEIGFKVFEKNSSKKYVDSFVHHVFVFQVIWKNSN